MRIEQGSKTIADLGYDKFLARPAGSQQRDYILRGDNASGDLKGLYPRPTVVWDNGTDTYDDSYVNVDGDTMTGTLTVPLIKLTNLYHMYGGFQNQNQNISISTVNTWYQVTNATNDLWSGYEANGVTLSADVMTLTNAGDYSGSLALSIVASNNKDFEFRVYNVTKSAPLGYSVKVTGMGAGNYVTVALPLYISVAAGTQLRLEVRDITDSTDIIINDAIFYLAYLHEYTEGPSASPSVSPSQSPSASSSVSPSVSLSPSISPSVSPSS